MQFTIINMLWTMAVFLFAFLFTLMLMQDDVVYSPMYSFLVLVAGLAFVGLESRNKVLNELIL